MWIILGNKVQTQLVAGGRRIERQCAACGEHATFYEREVNRTFRLYFVDLFNYETQRVMACGACGSHYATDELGRPLEPRAVTQSTAGDPQRGTVFGSVRDAFRRAGNALQDATGAKPDEDVLARERAADEQRQKGEPAKRTIVAESKRLTGEGGLGGDDWVDPLDEEDELEQKFKALEKRLARDVAQKPIK